MTTITHTAGFFVVNLITQKIVGKKPHNHYKTALNQAKRLGLETHAVRPCANLPADIAYAELVRRNKCLVTC